MAIKTINLRDAVHGIYDTNNVVPGVQSAVLFRAGNIHAADAGTLGSASVTDLKGSFVPDATGVEGSGVFTMPSNNYNYGTPAADQRFPSGHVTLFTEREKSKLTYSVNQEKGLAMYTISLELYVPSVTADIHNRLESFRGEPLHAVVKMQDKFEADGTLETDDLGDGQETTATGVAKAEYLLGWDNATGTVGAEAALAINDTSGFTAGASGSLAGYFYSDFCLFLDSIEFDSGAAITDKSGATLKFTSVQGSAPIRLIS